MGNKECTQPSVVHGGHKPSLTGKSVELDHLARIKRAEDTRKEAIASNTHDNIKENQQLLKKLFKRLDPSVSTVETDIHGEVQASIKYDFNNAKLLVNIIKCRDIGFNSITGKTAKPLIALSLVPDPENSGIKQTSNSNESQNPVYNEKFSFPLDEIALSDSRLVLKVIDHDLVNDEMEFLGEAIILMSDFNFMESSVHTAWYTLQAETDLTITGELEVELGYTLPRTLSVTVHQATNLKHNQQMAAPTPAVKVGIPGLDQVNVTESKKDEVNPRWDETFSFELPREELAMRYVVFTVIDQGSEDDALLGHVVIDLDNLDIDNGYRGLFPLSDMSRSDRLRSKWFQTTQVQEFREALWAHSFFQNPNLLFQSHTGKKVIRLTCQQAGGAKAKVRLNNGIPVV